MSAVEVGNIVAKQDKAEVQPDVQVVARWFERGFAKVCAPLLSKIMRELSCIPSALLVRRPR